jgi:beta-lactam-binding protein with PASTA domain
VTVSTGAPKVAVPSVIGLDIDKAIEKLEGPKYQLKVKPNQVESPETQGEVLEQDPVSGTEVQQGSTVTLDVAKKAAKSVVPDVTGKTCEEAKAQLKSNNLTGTCEEEESADVDPGKVISQSLTPQSEADPGSTVTLKVAKAAEKATVPNLAGQKLKDARKAIEDAGLTVGNIQGPQDDEALVVLSQPNATEEVDPGSAVNLTTAGGNQGDNGGDGGDDGGGFLGGNAGFSRHNKD